MVAAQFSHLVGAIGVALMVAALFGATLYAGLSIRGRMRGPIPFMDEILYEAGQRQHQALAVRDRQLLSGSTSFLILLLVSLAWFLIPPAGTSGGLPIWALILILILELGVLGAAGYLLFLLYRSRQPLLFDTWARKAVGHALQRTALRGFWTVHDVRENDRTLDHVVVGPTGVFLLSVVVRVPEPGPEGSPVAILQQGALHLGDEKLSQPLASALRNCRWLSEHLYGIVGHEIPVRSVLVVPGWSVRREGENSHLLVNERNVAMFTGWKQDDAYLMKEDMAKIQAELARMARNRWLD